MKPLPAFLDRPAKALGRPGLVIPLIITALFCLGFSRFLNRLLPEDSANVNAAFVTDLWQLILGAALGLYLLFLFVFLVRKEKDFVYANPARRYRPADGLLVLLPLTPVVQYVLHNQDILSLAGSLAVVGVFAAFSFTLVVLVPILFSVVTSPRTLAVMGAALAFTITNMASLTAHFRWFERGDLKIQVGLFTAVYFGGLLVYEFVGRRFVYFVLGLYFIANSVSSLPVLRGGDTAEAVPVTDPMVDLVADDEPRHTPNIYFLIFDAYVPNETMLGYGIDNGAQERFLVEAGFQLFPHTYSITASTVATISRVFSVSREYYGRPRTAISGDGPVQRLLQDFGYETCGVFWSDYVFQEVGSSYDRSFPGLADPHGMLTRAIFMGEFRFDFEFAKSPRPDFVAFKERVFSREGGRPRFVYVHDNLPGHSQNSGQCLPDEIARFEARLEKANAEMRRNVESILSRDPGALVIVAGDHGPYLTKNCRPTGDEYDISEITRHDVQDRYGSFLAIRWPDGGRIDPADIVVLQDLFPAVFTYLFEDDRFLSARIFPLTGSAAVLTSGVEVREGMIVGGPDDGDPLFGEPN